MSRKPLLKWVLLVTLVSCLLVLQGEMSRAQDATQTPQPITVSRSEPSQFTNGGVNGVLSVFGANFTDRTTIRLVGMGLLTVTFVNSGALTAVLPADLPTGTYGIEVSDPLGGTAASPNTLTVNAPPGPTQPPPTAVPTLPAPTEVPTLPPATIVPGQPSLIVRDFAAIPSIVVPGGPVALTLVLLNQGNRAALGVSVSLDSDGKFFPANGQADIALPDMPPGSSVQVTLNALAARDASEGPNNVPITASYRDFEGKTYTSTADLGVEISALNEVAQMTLTGYSVEPQMPAPGAQVIVHVSMTNTGNKTASRVLLRIAGEDDILLAGSQGDSRPLGDIAPGDTVDVDLPMVVNPSAESGPQSQPVTISFLQDGETKETSSSLTIEIARVAKPEALILLESYSIGDGIDSLSPGDRFTLTITLQNVGQADAIETLATFGTVDPPADSGSGSGGTGGSGGSSTTPSSALAPLGAGDTLYVGNLASGGSISLEQAFIVNSSVTSGIYSLPITVRYQKSDGSTAQQNLRASVIVIAPLRVQTSLASPLPEEANVGEPLPVSWRVTNNGENDFQVTDVKVTTENADILEGAETLLSPIASTKNETINAVIQPLEEGDYSVTFTLTYTDDLNRKQTLVASFDGEAVTPPPPPEMPPEMVAPPAEQEEEENLLGRLLLGFLGLGG
ncbi:MAG: hypothetical protein U0521_26175 [Anaerolineae bacterium]